MALFNYATKEIIVKVVYYGPGLSGKTTNLQYLHSVLEPDRRGKLLSLSTEADRTLFFDFLPIEVGKIKDFSIRFQLYTVPGQVRYNATRKLVLKGADAVIFVADSQREMREQNIESLKNMRENLIANNINPDEIPLIMQYNKRDLSNILSIGELNKDLNEGRKYEYVEAIAIDGAGVEDSFQRITKLAINEVSKRQSFKIQPLEEVTKITEEEKAPAEAIIIRSMYEEPVTTAPIIESTLYEIPEIEKTTYEATEMELEELEEIKEVEEVKEEPIRTTIEEKPIPPKEVIVKEVKEIKEVPIIPAEKLDMIINSINDISQALKGVKNVASNIHFEIKEMKKDQKEVNILLREIKNTFDKMKTKKAWFRFL